MKIAADWDLPRLEHGKGSYYPPLRFPWMGRDHSPSKIPDSGGVAQENEAGLRCSPFPQDNGFDVARRPAPNDNTDMLRRPPQDNGFDVARRPAPNDNMDMLRRPPPDNGFDVARRPAPNDNMDMLRRPPQDNGFDVARRPAPNDNMDMLRRPPQDNGFDVARQPAPNDNMVLLRRSPFPQDNRFDVARRPAPNDNMDMLRPNSFSTGGETHKETTAPYLPTDTVGGDGGTSTGGPADVDVEVRGSGQLPEAWRTWEEVTFPPRVRAPLVSAGFKAPTSIQQHSWPILSGGRDLIGIAKTGSGKTLAFLSPIFAQLLESRADLRGPPAALILAPTRELAVQIETEAKRFGETAGMRAACLYGGAPKGPQLAELRQRPQLLVATPGRLNDLLEPPAGLSVAVDVKSVRYLVLDEADRMLDMGFEPQIRKIISGLSKERQTVMFTATWPLSIRRLAADFLQNPVEVRAGEVDELRVNPDITQQVVFCTDMRQKEDWLDKILRESGQDQCIVFVNTKRMCEVVSLRTPNSMAIHGDKDQRERDFALGQFKSGSIRTLVATDVAARGLDIKAVRVVVNFDPPNREEDYVHRVGRTGRAGQKGMAWTLLTSEDGAAGRSIAEIFKRMGLPVPEELERRLASGELRSGARGRSRSAGPRRFLGPGMDDDFDTSGRFGSGFREDFSRTMNDCPTW